MRREPARRRVTWTAHAGYIVTMQYLCTACTRLQMYLQPGSWGRTIIRHWRSSLQPGTIVTVGVQAPNMLQHDAVRSHTGSSDMEGSVSRQLRLIVPRALGMLCLMNQHRGIRASNNNCRLSQTTSRPTSPISLLLRIVLRHSRTASRHHAVRVRPAVSVRLTTAVPTS